MRNGRPRKSTFKTTVKLSNLIMQFGELEVIQQGVADCLIWIDWEKESQGNEDEPPDYGNFEILKMYVTEFPIVFVDDRGIANCRIYPKCDLTQVLPEATMKSMEVYIETMLKSGQKFTAVDMAKPGKVYPMDKWLAKNGYASRKEHQAELDRKKAEKSTKENVA